MDKRYFLTRHSIKPKGQDKESSNYKGISNKGVELARASAKNIINEIEQSPKGAVIFLGGASDEVRTKSTAEVYGQELKQLLADRNDYVVITREDIRSGRGYSDMAAQVKKTIDANPDKRIIIDIPLFMKELAYKRTWLTKQGKLTDYAAGLVKKTKGNDYRLLKYWIENQGKLGRLKGPTPEEVAKNYEQGINRLEQFARKYTGDRPLVTGIVGHSLSGDVYLTYLAGNGKIDFPTFEKVSAGKGMIKETEMASVRVTPEISTLTYRGQEHRLRKGLENLTGIISITTLLLSFFSFLGITGNVIGTNTSNPLGLILIAIAIISGGLWIFLKNKQL